jgi:endoribonuclease Dicer
MEALIGAFYIGGGIKAGLAFLQHVQLADCPLEKLALYCGKKTAAAAAPGCNGNNNNTSQKMDAFFSSYLSSSSSILHSLDIHQVETALGGYKFHNPAFAQEALTHGSVLGARCYQRLEFLGDCILDLIVVHKAYHAYKGDISPAQLHDVRSITLNAERLALSAVRANLHTHILYHSAALFNRIDDFVVEAEAVVKRVGKEAAGGVDFRSRSSSSESAWDDVMVRYAFGLDRTCAPKVLSDITEALLGAVWLDSQGDWEVAAGVALHLLSPLPWIDGKVIMDRRQQLPIPPHPVRRLHVGV